MKTLTPNSSRIDSVEMDVDDRDQPGSQCSRSSTMKAMVANRYGSADVLHLEEVKKPLPKQGEVLIRIHAASVTTADGMMRRGSPFYGRLFIGLTKPKNPIPGTGFAGVIEALGEGVTSLKEGDQVFGEIVLSDGTNAEYVCVPEDGVLTKKPSNISFEEAAPVCDGAMTSLSFLKDVAEIRSGQKVLINGASGSLGTAAVQLAKHFGAEVTGVCSSANLELVKSLGADKVIDYTREDFTRNGQTYDIIYDTVGKSSFPRCKQSLTDDGVFVSPVLGLPLLLQVMWTARIGRKKAKFSATGIRPPSELRVLLDELTELLEAGKLRSVIDRQCSLEQTAEAHRYVEQGHKKGNVVISLDPDAAS